MRKSNLSLALLGIFLGGAGAQEASKTLSLRVVASRIVTQLTQGGSTCGFWTQNGYTWGGCNSS